MGDHNAANEDIWPSQNDVAQTAGNGKKFLENQWEDVFKSLTSGKNFVYSGFALPASDPDLNVSVPAGQAFISGRFVDIPGATTVTATANTTNHLFLKLARDGSNLVTGAVFEVNTTGTAPADSVKIGTMVASGSAVTSTTDQRVFKALAPFGFGPESVGTSSTRTHEGDVTISSNQNLSGTHFYTNFVLNASTTVTVPAGKRRLIIVATNSITINGTITATSAGGTGGSSSTGFTAGQYGTDQPSGPQPVFFVANTFGSGSTQLTASDLPILLPAQMLMAAGGSGGNSGVGDVGSGSLGGAGGNGGGSIVLIAPRVTLGSGATLTTNGSAGGTGTGSGSAGGGGGAGNVYIAARTYTNSGATLTMTGGANGSGGPGAGANGVRQITLY